jgi:prolyl oligopeptidase
VVETIGGVSVRDPFRGLEDRKAASAWIDAHDGASDAWFAAHPDEALDRRLLALSELGSLSSPRVAKGRTFFLRNDGKHEQPALVVREPGGAERTLLDLDALDASGKTALDDYVPSRTGKRLVYRLSKDGSEESVLHVLDVDAGKDLGVAIPDTRWSAVSWLPDDAGFYYTRYPAGQKLGQRIWFHAMGTDVAKDEKVFGDGRDPTDFPEPVVSDDGSLVAYVAWRGWSASDVYVEERDCSCRHTIQEGTNDKLAVVRLTGKALYGLSNRDAPRFRLVRIDLTNEERRWSDVRPQGDDTLESAAWAGGRFLVKTLDQDALARLSVVGADGAKGPEVPLPEAGAVYDVDAEEDSPRAVVAFSSFKTKSALLEIDTSAASPAPKPIAAIDTGALTASLSIRRARYPSYDGTPIPVWIVERSREAGTSPPAPRPTYLTGYGGFAVSLEPSFSSTAVAWLEKGGVYAMANLRGGNEFGEAWHQAGMRDKKFQVFEDMEHVMRGLARDGVATPSTLAIEGGSNGGLLMGAMMTRCPELFAACVGDVGLYDMVRYHLWPQGELWVDEYGSSKDEKQLAYLLSWSPYHNVVPGVRYPAFLGQTAEEDARVTWRHTAKFVAALEAAQAGEAPILFRLESKAGHGQGKNRSDRVKEQSRALRFLWAHVGGAAAESPR